MITVLVVLSNGNAAKPPVITQSSCRIGTIVGYVQNIGVWPAVSLPDARSWPAALSRSVMAEKHAPARILLLVTGIFMKGGIQRFNHTLLSALGTLDVECDVLSIHDSPEVHADAAFGAKIRIRGFSGSRMLFSKSAFGKMAFGRYDWILIGHVNLLVFSVASLLFKPLTRCRIALVAHGIEVWSGIGRLRRLAFLRVHKTLCVSRYTRGRILEQVPALRHDRVMIFPNCLSRTWTGLHPSAQRSEAEVPFVLSVTRLERGDRDKGIATVIEAVAQLDDPSLHYVIVGQGSDIAFLRQVAVRCDVAQRVHFMQGIPDEQLVGMYAQCKAFVLPSGKEGFGIVFLEAMYFGAPVIAASEKGVLDVVRDGETGLLVRFGDAAAIKGAIERLIADATLAQRLRDRGRASVVGDGEFTFTRFAQRTAAIFAPDQRHAV
jgi:glycosyltransferase involved in cell wall biosynthesis